MNIEFIIPGDLNLPTGGYRYDRAIIQEWRNMGHLVTVCSLPGNYPFPNDGDKIVALDMLTDISDADVAVVDGLAGGANPEFVCQLARQLPVVALVHHPLSLETGLDKESSDTLLISEAAGLKCASHIVTTSPATAHTVCGIFKTDPQLVSCVLPGICSALPNSNDRQFPVQLLCVGSIIERKGHRVLFEALGKLKHFDWHLFCVGKTDLDPGLYTQLQELVKTLGLCERITFLGAIDEDRLAGLYQDSHLFVLPSNYEGYGMAYAEAIAHGIPVIGTTAGAIPDTVPSDCGILVEPGNVSELSEAILVMLSNSDQYRRHRDAAIQSSGSFQTWEKSANEFLEVLKEVA